MWLCVAPIVPPPVLEKKNIHTHTNQMATKANTLLLTIYFRKLNYFVAISHCCLILVTHTHTHKYTQDKGLGSSIE